jgi:hypothetical protein
VRTPEMRNARYDDLTKCVVPLGKTNRVPVSVPVLYCLPVELVLTAEKR